MRSLWLLVPAFSTAALASCGADCPSIFTTSSSSTAASSSSGAPVCIAGTQVACSCGGTRMGAQRCTDDGSHYLECLGCGGAGGSGGATVASSSTSGTASAGGAGGSGGAGGAGGGTCVPHDAPCDLGARNTCCADADGGAIPYECSAVDLLCEPACVTTCSYSITNGGLLCAGSPGAPLYTALQICGDAMCATECAGKFFMKDGGLGAVCDMCLLANCPTPWADCSSN